MKGYDSMPTHYDLILYPGNSDMFWTCRIQISMLKIKLLETFLKIKINNFKLLCPVPGGNNLGGSVEERAVE